MNSSNRFYSRILLVIIIGCAFFFSTKLWLPDDRPKEQNNYKQLIQAGDWLMRLQGAGYNPSTKTMRVEILQEAQSDSPQAYKIKAYLGDVSNDNVLPSSISKQENNPNLCWLEIHDVPTNYYYVSLVLTATSSIGVTSAPSSENNVDSDIFADDSTNVIAASTTKKTILIDYRAAKKIAISPAYDTPSSASSAKEKGGK